MAKLDIECCPICGAPVTATETYNSVSLEYAGPSWISVEERLPEVPGEVIIVLYGGVCIAWYHCDGRFESGSGLVFSAGKSVTHWMPLPEPPKEDE